MNQRLKNMDKRIHQRSLKFICTLQLYVMLHCIHDFFSFFLFLIYCGIKSTLRVHIFVRVMDRFLNEPDFMVFGHIRADRGYAIPFKPISQGK